MDYKISTAPTVIGSNSDCNLVSGRAEVPKSMPYSLHPSSS